MKSKKPLISIIVGIVIMIIGIIVILLATGVIGNKNEKYRVVSVDTFE